MNDITRFEGLPDKLSYLAGAAALADPVKFAEAALPALMEANEAIAALVEAIDEEHNWATGTDKHREVRSAMYRLARSLGGRKF